MNKFPSLFISFIFYLLRPSKGFQFCFSADLLQVINLTAEDWKLLLYLPLYLRNQRAYLHWMHGIEPKKSFTASERTCGVLFTRWKIPAILHTHVAPKSPVTAKYTAQIDSSAQALSCHRSCVKERKRKWVTEAKKKKVINSRCVQRTQKCGKEKNVFYFHVWSLRRRLTCCWALLGCRLLRDDCSDSRKRPSCQAAAIKINRRQTPKRRHTPPRRPQAILPQLPPLKRTHARQTLDISHFPGIYILDTRAPAETSRSHGAKACSLFTFCLNMSFDVAAGLVTTGAILEW